MPERFRKYTLNNRLAHNCQWRVRMKTIEQSNSIALQYNVFISRFSYASASVCLHHGIWLVYNGHCNNHEGLNDSRLQSIVPATQKRHHHVMLSHIAICVCVQKHGWDPDSSA